jgi:hypothetical protein
VAGMKSDSPLTEEEKALAWAQGQRLATIALKLASD